ncbi:dihydrofolate reductase family protein [Streptomyces nigrescens]
MRKIILPLSVSVDGFFEGPDHEIDWHLVDDELHQYFNDWLRPVGAFLTGRVTHELMAGFWPTADADPANAGPMAEFAGIWRDMPKYVFSRTLDDAGGDLVLGGPDLAEAFRRHDLIDEYRLFVHPVLIGRGKPLFRTSDTRTPLELAGTRTFGNGVVLLHYRRAGAAAAG